MKFMKPNYWRWENHCGLNVNCPHDHVLERLSLQLLVFLWEAVEALSREAQCLRWQGWTFGATARPPLLPGKQTLVLPLRTELPKMDSRWFSSPWSCFSLSYFVKMTRKVTNKIMRNYVQSPEHTEYDYLTVVILITSPWNTTPCSSLREGRASPTHNPRSPSTSHPAAFLTTQFAHAH